MRRKLFLLWAILIVIIPLVYLFAGRELIVSAISGKAPDWFAYVITVIYPRFSVEKHRFDLLFFLSRADQVIIRFCLLQIGLLGFALLYNYRVAFHNQVHNFWNSQISVRQGYWVKMLFYLVMLFFTYDWFYYINLVRPAAVFYKPLLLFSISGIGFPSVTLTGLLFCILILSYTAVLLDIKPVLSAVVATVLFLLFQGWLFSFEKIDHAYSTLTYAALVMPFLMHEHTKAAKLGQHTQAGWPSQLICVCIAVVYFMAGLEKLLIAGVDWVNPESFRSYLYLHQAPAGLWVAKSDVLCTVLPLFAMLFQLGFVFILFYPRLKTLILLSGIAFHIGTYMLLEVGWYINAWVMTYIFFIDWTWLDQYQFRKHTEV
jgi:hypothetical protein